MLLKALCKLAAEDGILLGTIYFHQEGPKTPVQVYGVVSGLGKGLHAFHVHQWGSCINNHIYVGPHFDSFDVKHDHGPPNAEERHVGDLGNIEAGDNGVAKVNIMDKVISLEEHRINSIIGRVLAVHVDPDDMGLGQHELSAITGNAGASVAFALEAIEACGFMGYFPPPFPIERLVPPVFHA